MEKVYFINSEQFINKIIEQGKLEINTCHDVIRYMDLAIKFWDNKRKYFEGEDKTKEQEARFLLPFKQNDYIQVSEYFSDGEVYSLEELKMKILNDTGIITDDEVLTLIRNCIKLQYIYEVDEGVFTR